MENRADGRTLRHAHRRPELLARSAEHVLARGISGLSMRSLAAELGLTHATLTHHFGGRDALLAQVIEWLADRELAFWADGEPDLSLADLTRRLWDHYTSPEGAALFRLMFEAVGLMDQERELYRDLLQRMVFPWQTALCQLVEAQGVDPARAETLATLAVAQFRGLQLDLLATGDRARVERALETWLTDVVAAQI